MNPRPPSQTRGYSGVDLPKRKGLPGFRRSRTAAPEGPAFEVPPRRAPFFGPGRRVTSAVVSALAVRHGVEALALLLLVHAQSDGEVHHLEGHEGDHARPDQRDAHAPEL